MMHLSVAQISHSFGANTVLAGASFILSLEERAGLVGANGSGKTTLLRIIADEITPDSGVISINTGLRVSYLPQHPPEIAETVTVSELINSAIGDLRRIACRLRELELAMTDPARDLEAVFDEYGRLQAQFEDRGGYEIDHRVDLVLDGLGLGSVPRDQPVVTLSGGETGRLRLAMVLLQAPDILLLDEPTNHLDFAAIDWLGDFLATFHGTVLVVSHDRHFLNRTVTQIFEIDEHSHELKAYSGNYDFYRQMKEREVADWEERYAAQQKEIKELNRLIRVRAASLSEKAPAAPDADKSLYNAQGARAEATQAKNIRWFKERLRRLEEDPVPKPPTVMRINPNFDTDELRSSEIIRIDGIEKSFDSKQVLRDVNAVIGRRDRVVIVAPNGSGKSTLLDIIAGLVEPDAGTVTYAPGVRIGYLDQDAGSMNPEVSVFDTYRKGLVGHEHHFVSDLIRHGLFRYDDLDTLVGELSLGQRRKLQIARFIAEDVNVLLLDEPTNHLSLDILEEFERALAEFSGPILAASHDRWFIERFNGVIWTIDHGRLEDQFAASTRAIELQAALVSTGQA